MKNFDKFLYNYTHTILPITEEKLNDWYNVASKITEKDKSEIAKKSIERKKIHSYGGVCLASDMRDSELLEFIDILIALSLILDYTDDIIEIENLSFKQAYNLTESLVLPLKRNFKKNIFSEKLKSISLEYLQALTETVYKNIRKIKNYRFLESKVVSYMRVFSISQAISSEEKTAREKIYKKWYFTEKINAKELKWNEFAAAQASPLRSYALLKYSYNNKLNIDEIKSLINTYKWFGIINVLGDHIIDEDKDKRNEEINQISKFRSTDDAKKRFLRIVSLAKKSASELPNKSYHYFVLNVLLNMYMEPLKYNDDWGRLSNKICDEYHLPKITKINVNNF